MLKHSTKINKVHFTYTLGWGTIHGRGGSIMASADSEGTNFAGGPLTV